MNAAGLLLAVAMAGAMTAQAAAPAQPAVATVAEPVRVVYQFSDGAEQALRGLRNIHNHLNADPTAKIVVVAFGRGIDFLVDGANDANGQPFDASVAALTARGVEFRICANTLRALEISADKVNPEAVVVPSGVAEIARLQVREGRAYIRP
ncbi:DsrE family protein [Nevskia sp.]|uniref:DsrE family protein n=1 Tax=Nevskia sp. TaxID=1929292 RepID=UPI0025E9A088|nr:DsrE family protein [Nevskia sp.]